MQCVRPANTYIIHLYKVCEHIRHKTAKNETHGFSSCLISVGPSSTTVTSSLALQTFCWTSLARLTSSSISYNNSNCHQCTIKNKYFMDNINLVQQLGIGWWHCHAATYVQYRSSILFRCGACTSFTSTESRRHY